MSPQLRTFWIRLTADKKKFGALCTCGFVALLLWGRFVFLQEVPRTAYADPKPTDPTQVDQPRRAEPTTNLSDRRTVNVRVRTQVTRDPFALDPGHFPKPVEPETVTQLTPKSPDGTTDKVTDDQAELSVPEEATRRLSLVSVIGGPNPIAMLRVKDGPAGGQGETMLIGVGRKVAGFRLVSVDVTGRAIIVEKNGIRVTLTMLEDGS